MAVTETSQGTGWIRLGALLAGISVITGAFAAHGLEPRLLELYDGKTHQILGATIPSAQKYLGDFKTGAEYQMTHSLAMILIGVLLARRPGAGLKIAAVSFLIGILLFSGSLYTLVLTGQRWMGAITPFGGISFIIGWMALAFASLGTRQSAEN